MMMQEKFEGELNAEISRWEYLSHWISIEDLAKSTFTDRFPLKRLRKYEDLSLMNSEGATNRIYIEKMILIAVAVEKKINLYTSKKFYIRKDGLIFGVYRFDIPGLKKRRLVGIDMVEQVSPEMTELILEEKFLWFTSPINQLRRLIHQYMQSKISTNDHKNGQYVHWMKGVTKFVEERMDVNGTPCFRPYEFLSVLNELPLNQHYIFKVKLENAMLMPVFLQSFELREQYRLCVEKEMKLLKEIFESNDMTDIKAKFDELSEMTQEICDTMYQRKKTGKVEEGRPFFKEICKGKMNENLMLTTKRNYAIILSPYRGMMVTYESASESEADKDEGKSCTKIEIKACNQSIQPISGNVIFVKMSWSVSLSDKQAKLMLQCCNNRKVQEMHYQEVCAFWEKLQNNEKFRELIGVDKFIMSLNEDSENLEVVFSNNVPGCLLTNSLVEVDKIVILALVLDEVIQICEQKGNEKEYPKKFCIKDYMIDHAIMRFQRATKELESRCESLYNPKDLDYQSYF